MAFFAVSNIPRIQEVMFGVVRLCIIYIYIHIYIYITFFVFGTLGSRGFRSASWEGGLWPPLRERSKS